MLGIILLTGLGFLFADGLGAFIGLCAGLLMMAIHVSR